MGTPYEIWMRRCLALAWEARSTGESPVGAVIVRDGRILAEASEHVKMPFDVTGHAELIAIRDACRILGTMDLPHCTLYTNVEPCWMCSFAIRETGISQVVIGAPIAEIGGATSGFPILSSTGVSGWGPPPEIVWAALEENGKVT
jgi:tRNA(adenine34) deaminase